MDLKKQEVLGRTNRLLSSIRREPHWNDASNNSSIVACVFVTAVTFLPIRCLATTGGFLPSRYQATIRVFLPSRCLAKGVIHRHTERQQRDLISLLNFFQNKESRLNTIYQCPRLCRQEYTIEIETAAFTEMLALIYKTTRRHISEDRNLQVILRWNQTRRRMSDGLWCRQSDRQRERESDKTCRTEMLRFWLYRTCYAL
jgi:hypothetical protein